MVCIKQFFKTVICIPIGMVMLQSIQAQSTGIHALQFNTVAETQAYFHYTGQDVPIISGHRGGAQKGFPENCLPTFEHTLSVTPAMFEIDPRLTQDSGIVLLHDPTLERITTGHGKLIDHTMAQAEKLQLRDLEGNPTPYHFNTLDKAIQWAKGKTILNLDVKDVPLIMKAEMVKKYDAFPYVMFTVHNAEEAKFFYTFDHRSMFSAWILTKKAFAAYEKTGIPWPNFLIAYIGPAITEESAALRDMLHKKGVMVMVGVGPSDDHLENPEKRGKAYRQLIKSGIDIIESDRPIEVAKAIQSLYPKKSSKYKYWKEVQLKK